MKGEPSEFLGEFCSELTSSKLIMTERKDDQKLQLWQLLYTHNLQTEVCFVSDVLALGTCTAYGISLSTEPQTPVEVVVASRLSRGRRILALVVFVLELCLPLPRANTPIVIKHSSDY